MDPVTLKLARSYADERGVFSKFDATEAPGVNDDNTEGFAPGSLWVDVTNKTAYVCTDASTGAAEWEIYTGLSSHLSENTSHYYEEANEEISINFRNRFFFIDENNDVFFSPDGDGNAGSSLGEQGYINLWEVV